SKRDWSSDVCSSDLDDLTWSNFIIKLRIRVRAWIIGVHAIYALRQEQDLAPDFQRTLSSGGIGGEKRHAHAGTKDDDATLFEVTLSAQRQVWLRNLCHIDGSLNAAVDV